MTHIVQKEQGFLLISFLIVFSAMLAMAMLSLDMTRQLWKACQLELAHSETQNAQRVALIAVQNLVQANAVPTTCWHHSVKPWLSVQDFEHDPRRGCTFNLAAAQHNYWLEVTGEKFMDKHMLVHYQLSLISSMQGLSLEVQTYGVTLN